MDQNSIIALAVAGVVSPWLVEIIKTILPGDYSGKKGLTLSMIFSVLIAGGVLWYRHALNWNDPSALFASAGLVLGVAGTVYQFLKNQVQKPIDKLSNMISK